MRFVALFTLFLVFVFAAPAMAQNVQAIRHFNHGDEFRGVGVGFAGNGILYRNADSPEHQLNMLSGVVTYGKLTVEERVQHYRLLVGKELNYPGYQVGVGYDVAYDVGIKGGYLGYSFSALMVDFDLPEDHAQGLYFGIGPEMSILGVLNQRLEIMFPFYQGQANFRGPIFMFSADVSLWPL